MAYPSVGVSLLSRNNFRIPLTLAVAILSVFCGIPSSAPAQSSTGFPPFGTFQTNGIDSINENNLNVHLEFPLFHKAEIGLPVNFRTGYDSSDWSVNSSATWAFTTGWAPWGIQSAIGSLTLTVYNYSTGCVDDPYKIYVYTYLDSAGTSHVFEGFKPPGTPCGVASPLVESALDNSGYTLVYASGAPAMVYDSAGNKIEQESVVDPDGNSLTSSDGVSITDTLGLTALSGQFTQVNNTTQTYTYTYTGPGGTQAPPIVVTYSQLGVGSHFGCTGYSDAAPAATYLVTNIALPDGTSYGFSYEPIPGNNNYVTGRIAKITLPTGGNIQYTYGYWSASSPMCYTGTPASLTRTTSDGAQWQYSRNSTGTVTTVTDPTTKNQTVYTFSAASYGYETQRQIYQNGALAKTLVTCYNGNFSNCASAAYPGNVLRQDIYATPANGKTSLSETFYNTNGLLTQDNEFDYGVNTGTAPTTTPIRSTIISYASPTSGSYVNNRPACIQVTAGTPPSTCGTVTSNTATLTLNTYDSLASGSVSLGNLTQTKGWVSGSAYLNNSFTYYSDGLLETATDPGSNVTSYGAQECGPNNKQAFPSTITKGGLSKTITWDCNGGLPTQVSDANSQPTEYGYDTSWRLISTTDPLGYVTDTLYTPATSTTPATIENYLNFPTSNPTSTVDNLYTLDGFGRLAESQKRTAPSAKSFDNTTVYTYGWTSSGGVTGPFTTQTVPGATGVTTTQFDALGRTASIVDGGGGSLGITYLQNDALSMLGPPPTNENYKQVQNEYDSLGRVTKSCAIGNGYGTACNQNSGTANGVTTSYSYTYAAGNSTVAEIRGAQTRSKTYDALGRVISVATPESGTTTYTYDSYPAGTCGGWTSEPGELMLVSWANGNSKCYVYDALHRVTDTEGYNSTSAICQRFRYDNTQGVTGTMPSGIAIANTMGRMAEAETDNCGAYPPTTSTIITDEWFSYDQDGHITDMWELTPHSGQYYHSTAIFAANGMVTSLQLASPSLYTMSYGLDGEGRWSTLTEGTTKIVTCPTNPCTTMYDSGGRVVNVQLTGTTPDQDIYTYDQNTGRMLTFEFEVGNTPANLKGTLTWNPNGSLGQLQIADGFNSGGSQTCYSNSSSTLGYGYDDWARLAEFDCGSGNWGQQYSYDQYDNLKKTVISGRSGSTWNPTYTSNNQIQGATYDASGNLTNDNASDVYGWDQFNKLQWAASSGTPTCGSSGKCITYDAFGRMVETSNGSVWKEIWYTQVAGSTVNLSGTTENYAYWPSPGRGTYIDGGTKIFLHQDWLGNDRIASEPASHSVIADRAYAPYGEQYNTYGSTNPIYGIFAEMSGDYDSGVLFDTPNRELASAQGRWLSPDPAGAGWNQYAYATDPNSFVDPTGLACYPLERKLWGGVCQPEVDPWGESWDIDTIDPTPLFAWQSPSLSFDNPVANSTIVFDDGSVYPIGVTEQITDGSNAELSGGGWVQVGYNWIDNDSTGGAVAANNGPGSKNCSDQHCVWNVPRCQYMPCFKALPPTPTTVQCVTTPGDAVPELPGAAPEQPDAAPGPPPPTGTESGQSRVEVLSLIFGYFLNVFRCFVYKFN